MRGARQKGREGGGRKEEKGKEEGKIKVYKHLNGGGRYNFLLALFCLSACVPRWKERKVGKYPTIQPTFFPFLAFILQLYCTQHGHQARSGGMDAVFFFSLGVSMTVQSFTASHTVHHTVTCTACICTAFTSFCCLQSLTAQMLYS